MNKTLTLISIISSFLFAILCSAFVIAPEMSGLIWIAFSTFAVVTALNGEIRKIHIYLIAIVLGWIWAFAYNYALIGSLTLLNLSMPVAMFVAVLVVTIIIMLVHCLVLQKTPFNLTMVPLAFMPVMALFATNGQNISKVNIVIAQVLGILLATIISLIAGLLIKTHMKKANVPQ